eukprot:TRINITY_DN1419_c0_g1_i1.p1 TRINITY_DN1419_c0_g1~~TRINITY_DN1419_c0_g1_i1.p1  ORF type:complete len:242 (-),score=41.00 TRINITY_DN1419_c0_g1_i1:112-759(-)
MSRISSDIQKLKRTGFPVKLKSGNMHEFEVVIEGPSETLYEGGTFNTHVILPHNYPFSSPSIGFITKVFHPNVDEGSGTVCLDVINQTWSPMFDLVNVFDTFLPQLLTYPNPTDPLNAEAATLMIRDKDRYRQKVRDYVRRFATVFEEKEAEVKEAKVDPLSLTIVSGSEDKPKLDLGKFAILNKSSGEGEGHDRCESELSDLSDMDSEGIDFSD